MALSTGLLRENGNFNFINRMRIKHTSLTHQYLQMKKEDPPICASCGTTLSIEHTESECLSYETYEWEAGIANNLSEAFHPDNIKHNMIIFINYN